MVQYQPQAGQTLPSFWCAGERRYFNIMYYSEFFFLIRMSPSTVRAGAGWQLQSEIPHCTSSGVTHLQGSPVLSPAAPRLCRGLHYPWQHRTLRIKSLLLNCCIHSRSCVFKVAHLLICFVSSVQKHKLEFWQIFREEQDWLLLQKGICETRLPGHIPNIYILPYKVHFCCQIQPHCSSSSQKYKTA